MLQIDFTFPHAYEVEEVRELPGTGKLNVPVIFFPQPKSRPEHDGLWLRVSAASGRKWIGVFKFGYSAPPVVSRVVSSPDPNRVCVLSEGAAYLVRADEPEAWERIPATPVLDVRCVLEQGLLILADFTHMAALDRNGLVWQSPRVCWDGLKIVSITSETIEGTGYDPTSSHESRFLVDLKTGRSLLPPPLSTDGRDVW
jgi:hypothetical protein